MANIELKNKIRALIAFFVFFAALYMTIGLYLLVNKSSISSFDPQKGYELFKDTLTLVATFLAPVAAFVLFSDWKGQHYQSKIEIDSQKIYESAVEYYAIISKIERFVQKKQLDNQEYLNLIENREKLRASEEEFYRRIVSFYGQAEYKSISGDDFYSKSKSVYRKLKDAAGSERNLILGLEKNIQTGEYVQKIDSFQENLFSGVYDNLDLASEYIIDLTGLKSKVKSLS
ncbi:hypothetical protein GCM10025882_31800 [Acinetobacter gyllenbergii]|uniref:Uncharacterized protein n=1 Tax=Acinetobacter gyllenbergii CIP 110306 = MTCC 11365 TaxID=1217657 RepID=A0A829HCN4_9GAMM|nr:hypothetical protein [Acinetobacter gyllenbergii]EPF72554.1 hypothetical protein F957_03690 [Acinetobacter gyllenbergii CIP 110306 = MTCC 11365]EPH31079.1 hypothetical protein L293_2482 [Acinetobacter gyllenbergii CIP 110306 = MTCC 11365]GMA12755.1 hypothetical protein GCM10025882_31800 [Acinetobacter gyllenbergii]